MGIIDRIRKARALNAAWSRLEEAHVKGKLITTLLAIGGAALTAIMAKLTTACPDLLANVGPLLVASGGGAWAYVKLKEKPAGSFFVGVASAFVASGGVYLRQLCGPDFFTTLPTILTAGAWVGLMAWLRQPKEV